MNSFNGDKKIKLLIQKEIEWHTKQDKLAQGSYSSNGKFCAVGCAIESTNKKLGTHYSHGDHQALENQFGIPRILWRLEDRIFEGLSKKDAMKWPLQFWKSLPVGADLEMVWPKFAVWLLNDEKDGVIQYTKTAKQKKSIQRVVDLYNRKIQGKNVTQKQWADAYAAAAATDAYAADAAYAAYAAAAATDAYAAADAADAADAAAYAAAAAADAYAAADAADAARQKFYIKMANKLLELLKETK